MKTIINEDTLDRLAKAIMVKHGVGYEEALELLSKFQLNLICDHCIARSAAQQAALLTAINTGKRAFHGGVCVCMPAEVPCLINWPGCQTLNEAAQQLGARIARPTYSEFTQTIYLGDRPAQPPPDSFRLVCTGWRGGVIPADNVFDSLHGSDFALGGIAAGALGVALGFLRVSGISTRDLTRPHGISLWRPDLDWTLPETEGPELESLPKNLWMLGLGHLGQAFLWAFALLPYSQPSEARFLLQDFDKAVKGNYSSGLLCELENIGRPKTRICCDWLEARGFETTIVERAFDANTKRTGEEPSVACCGFDAAEPRRPLESAGFDLVVECALGADTARFDRIILHTFPDASRKATDIWATSPQVVADQKLVEAFKTKEDCGILAETLAKKAISSSFTGAFAGALVAAEILRALHGGIRAELIQLQLRHNDSPGVIVKPENYLKRVARIGFAAAAALREMAA